MESTRMDSVDLQGSRPQPQKKRPVREAKTWDRVKRLIQMSKDLQAAPMTTAMMARAYGTSQRTIQRDIEVLRELGHDIPLPDRLHRYVILQRGGALLPAQALAAYAAVRLAYHHSPSHNRHYRDAMLHISAQLPERIRYVLGGSVLDNGAGQMTERELEKVATAWVEGRVLSFDYQRPGGELDRGNRLCVYFLEISRSNLAPYVIGLEQRRGQLRTFKLSRMRTMEVLRDTYEPDESFDPREFLSDAWGVVGSQNPITVQVRFASEAAYRLDEGGYPNATFHKQPDGSVLAEFRAGTDKTGLPRELMPFLLGWGPRAEVLGPPEVRAHWLSELRETLRRYDNFS
ncbi:helix-turn-helix transcriptional regulator [Deinococcus proteolyticus]|nr:WYL domain-containing protein [Deinococcus proteolyticus]